MKFNSSSRFFLPFLNRHSPLRFRISFFTTKTLTASSSDTLFRRISPIRDPKISITPILDQWLEEGKPLSYEKAQSLVHKMRRFKRSRHALEISQWMTDRRYFDLSPKDVAVRLNLIYEIHGIEHAEKYFNNIAKQLRLRESYGALLNCYVKEKAVEKAEAMMREMEKLGFIATLPYNLLANLYGKTGQQEKIDILMEEMKEKGIPQNKYTFASQLHACVAVSDIGGMESLLNQMEKDPKIYVDWKIYALAARGYIKVGAIGKALALLKTIEEMIIKKKIMEGFDHLLIMYTNCGMKDEVYRVWNLYKAGGKMPNSSWKMPNSSYCCMITSLANLGDVTGAEEIFSEWESSGRSYDFRVLNRLIAAYGKKGLLEKAEAVVKKAVEKASESRKTPYASTWNILALGYLENKQMLKVVEMLKEALLVAKPGWKPNPVIVNSCLEYLEQQGNVKEVEEFVTLLRGVT